MEVRCRHGLLHLAFDDPPGLQVPHRGSTQTVRDVGAVDVVRAAIARRGLDLIRVEHDVRIAGAFDLVGVHDAVETLVLQEIPQDTEALFAPLAKHISPLHEVQPLLSCHERTVALVLQPQACLVQMHYCQVYRVEVHIRHSQRIFNFQIDGLDAG